MPTSLMDFRSTRTHSRLDPRKLVQMRQRLRTRMDFFIPAAFEFVVPAARLICHIARLHGLPRRVWGENLPLAVNEALANAIEHGCTGDAEREVTVSIRARGQVFQVSIADPGEGFKPEAVADPLADQGLTRPGGRGLLLMRELADRVRILDGGRVVRLSACRRPGEELG